MSGNRRKNNSEITISLFSFQDIITCLSGIMILLVLLITVDVFMKKLDTVTSRFEKIEQHKANKPDNVEGQLKQEIEQLKKMQIESEHELSEHQIRLKELNLKLTELEKEEKSVANQQKRIAFIPAKDANPNQRAIIIECSGESIRTVSKSFAADLNGIRDFIQSLQHLDKLRDYPLFIIKPSASDYAMQLVQQVQSMGFDAGYDAMPENETTQ
ncbi:MAG: hypothetical protein HQK73_11535 [Desulfamplus sp.]|nr:hypothetical protein [Desulfamplus sp.]MBF0412964.1 hypothetical protein [Desulfamplus sp.]